MHRRIPVPGEANVTLAMFNNLVEMVLDRIPLVDVKALAKESCVPPSRTALDDAIG